MVTHRSEPAAVGRQHRRRRESIGVEAGADVRLRHALTGPAPHDFRQGRQWQRRQALARRIERVLAALDRNGEAAVRRGRHRVERQAFIGSLSAKGRAKGFAHLARVEKSLELRRSGIKDLYDGVLGRAFGEPETTIGKPIGCYAAALDEWGGVEPGIEGGAICGSGQVGTPSLAVGDVNAWAEILRLLRIATLESRGFGPWTNNFRDLPSAALGP